MKSIFQSSSQNSIISKDQVQILRNWNNAVAHGCTNQETFNRIIANADDNTKMYFAGLNKGKGSIEGLKNAQNVAKQSTIGLTIAQTALNMAISMGLTAAISLAIKWFDKLINSAKRASEAADKAFSDTNEKVQQNEEEAKSLDELISKYKELKENGNLDIDGRKEVKELQNDIADLVGTQAKNLDLVNGKLDDEIKKLDEISAKEAKNAYETATANYNNSQKASAKATGDDSFLFVDGYAYIGKREKEAEKILQDAGFDNVQAGGNFGNKLFVRDDFNNDFKELKGAQEKSDYLQSMIDVLEQNGQRATDLYAGLIKQRDAYLKYIDNQQNAANSLVNSWIAYSQFSNEELSKINVDSVESFDTYHQKMIEEAKNDESVGKILADGTLSDEDLEKAVNDFMATSLNFSKWYEQWLNNIQDPTSNNKKYILNNLTNAGLSKDIAQQVVDGFSDADIQAIIDSKDIDWSSVTRGFTENLKNADWYVAVDRYKEAMEYAGDYLKIPEYQKTGNVSNIDNLMVWTEEQIAQYKDVLDAWNLDVKEGQVDYERNFILSNERIEDTQIGAVATFYTPDGAEILTPESLREYLDKVYEEASKLEGGATPENILKIDEKGLEQQVNGATKKISNMIYAVGNTYDDIQYESGKKLNFTESTTRKYPYQEVVNQANLLGRTVDELTERYDNLGDAASVATNRIIDSVAKAGTITFDDIFKLQDVKNKLTPLGEANKQINELQNAYTGLKSAMDSYNETGYFTVDQVQSIISYGGEYLKYLMDENGNLQLNEEALNRVAEARINEMRAKAITNLFDVLSKINGEVEAQSYLEQQLYETSDAYDALTESKIKDLRATLLEKNISEGTVNALETSFKKQVSAINEMFDNIDLRSFSGSAKKESKSASDSAKEQISSYMEYMKQSLESGRIDYQTYCRDVTNYLNDMYTKGKMSLKEYHDYAKQMFEAQKSILDGVISAVTKKIDKQIDSLNEQKEAIESNYKLRIESIQSEIDALEEANEKRQDQIDLEKKQYELERARQQRVNALYTADKGKIYTTDASTIRDAQDELTQKQHDMKISQLKSQIESLQDAMDSETKAIDDQIKALNRYKEQWSSVADQYEDNQKEMYAAGILGNNWQQEVLNGNLQILNDFANEYFNIQRKIQEEAWASANAQIEAANAVANRTDYTPKKPKDDPDEDIDEDILKNKYGSNAFGGGKWVRQKYASGTTNAKKGLNLVGEDGIETFIDNDGNISLVTEPTLIPMEGGEIVKNESETKSLLDGSNLVPLQTSGLLEKLSANVPDLSSIIKVNTPDYSKLGEVVSKSQIIEQHNQFNISLPNITDNTKATKLFEELQRLPLDALQYSTKRKK